MSGTQLPPASCCPAWLIQVRMEGATQQCQNFTSLHSAEHHILNFEGGKQVDITSEVHRNLGRRIATQPRDTHRNVGRDPTTPIPMHPLFFGTNFYTTVLVVRACCFLSTRRPQIDLRA